MRATVQNCWERTAATTQKLAKRGARRKGKGHRSGAGFQRKDKVNEFSQGVKERGSCPNRSQAPKTNRSDKAEEKTAA